MAAAIDVDGLTKRYGDVLALDDLDLTVQEGETYGFLGPNGAGKSTTIDVLLDFVRPTEGQVRVLGQDVQRNAREVRRRVGVLPEGYRPYERLTGRQHVEFVMQSKGVEDDPDRLLERVGIADAADRKAGGYSKGMAQRLVLAMALVGDPDLLILDEPTTGLDPNGARAMREMIREESDRGATVFFSSHVLAQVEAVCDQVGILQNGRLVAEDSIEGLRARRSAPDTVEIVVESTDGVESALQGVDGVERVSFESGSDRPTGADPGQTTVVVDCESGAKLPALNAVDRVAPVVDFHTRESSLEDLFADITEQRRAERRGQAPEGDPVPAESGGAER